MVATPLNFTSPSARRDAGGQLNLGASSELTIASGAITVSRGFHTIDTEADAASDNLDTVNGLVIGSLYMLMAADDTRTVVIRDGMGNIQTIGGTSITLNSDKDMALMFSPDGANLQELASADIA